MAYNKRNHLEKIVEIQAITMKEKKRGATQIWIYNNMIRCHYHISKSTYDKYLAMNARRELTKLNGD